MFKEIELESLEIKDEEVLRYLGYDGQELSAKFQADLERCRELVLKVVKPRFVYGIFKLEREQEGIRIGGSELVLKGKDIAALLKDSESCVLLAATLGNEIERAILYQERVSVSDALLMDAIATTTIEAVCDQVEEHLKEEYQLTWRYSCGYGDLPLDIQPKILRVLNTAKRIGLQCNSKNIMMPRKSVTAIIGITEGEATKGTLPSCEECLARESCQLKKGGQSCGDFRKNKK